MRRCCISNSNARSVGQYAHIIGHTQVKDTIEISHTQFNDTLEVPVVKSIVVERI